MSESAPGIKAGDRLVRADHGAAEPNQRIEAQ